MTPRIAEAIAQTLENARMYLAKLPVEDQNFVVINDRLVNTAIPILMQAEIQVRTENAQF